MSKIKTTAPKPKVMYSRFREGCTAEFLGEPDAKGVQAARITDPTMNDGVPFVGLTKPAEWATVPLLPTPAVLPEFVDVVIWEDEEGVHMDAVSEALPQDWDDTTTVGYFRCKVPSMITPLH